MSHVFLGFRYNYCVCCLKSSLCILKYIAYCIVECLSLTYLNTNILLDSTHYHRTVLVL